MFPFIDSIQNGDSFQLVKQIPDKSVDLILTDPPYFLDGEAGYRGVKWDSIGFIIPEEYHLDAKGFAALPQKERAQIAEDAVDQYFRRIVNTFTPKLKPTGAFICFNRLKNIAIMKSELAKQTINKEEFLAEGGNINVYHEGLKRWEIDQDIEWLKVAPNPNVAEINQAEYALVAFNLYGVVKHPLAYSAYANVQIETGTTNQYIAHSPFNEDTEYGKNTGHLTPKPFTIWRDLIRKFSNPGDIIFDPYSGSGTTALASYDMNRHFIAFEFDKEQYQRSRNRLEVFKEIMPRSAFPTMLGVLPTKFTLNLKLLDL